MRPNFFFKWVFRQSFETMEEAGRRSQKRRRNEDKNWRRQCLSSPGKSVLLEKASD